MDADRIGLETWLQGLPAAQEFESAGPQRDTAIRFLQTCLNVYLQRCGPAHQERDSEFLARLVIDEVEGIMKALNQRGFDFGRVDYGGDVDYRDSEQLWGTGTTMGTGLMLEFRGFSCSAYWSDGVS